MANNKFAETDYEFLRKKLESQINNRSNNYTDNSISYWNKVTSLFRDDVSKIALYKFIRSQISILNLYNVHPHDVLIESIVRGFDYITKSQKSIDNPTAWLRVTSINILLEKVREIKNYYQWSDDLDRIDLNNESEDRECFSEHPGKALQAFRSLPKLEQKIIIYRLFQNKKYSEIREIAHYKSFSEAAIRQHYCRAIKNLRKIFKQIVPDQLL